MFIYESFGNESYLPDSDSFNPERWIDEHKKETKKSRFTFIPFGFGTRMCIGRRITELEIYL